MIPNYGTVENHHWRQQKPHHLEKYYFGEQPEQQPVGSGTFCRDDLRMWFSAPNSEDKFDRRSTTTPTPLEYPTPKGDDGPVFHPVETSCFEFVDQYHYPGITLEQAIQQDQEKWEDESSIRPPTSKSCTSSERWPPRRPEESLKHEQHFPPDAPQATYYRNSMEDPLLRSASEPYYSGYPSISQRGAEDVGAQCQMLREAHCEYARNAQHMHPLPPQCSMENRYSEYGPPAYFYYGEALPVLSYPPHFPPSGYAGEPIPMNSSSEPKPRRVKTFPEKFMKVLVENPNENAIAWLPDGRSFVIVNPDLFTTKVLDKAFKKAKYASFIRKLHRWGFVRLTSGTGTDCFYHPQFTINEPELASNINCIPPSERINEQGTGDQHRPSLAGVECFIRAKLVTSRLSGDKEEVGIRSEPS